MRERSEEDKSFFTENVFERDMRDKYREGKIETLEC
jgi:hypothetical protein